MACSWCNTDPVEAAARHEGPHATWCPHYKREERTGMRIEIVREYKPKPEPKQWIDRVYAI